MHLLEDLALGGLGGLIVPIEARRLTRGAHGSRLISWLRYAAAVICANCGPENESGRKFCKECASRLAAVCPSCGTLNPSDAKYCGECATPLDEGVPTAVVAGSRAGPAEARQPADNPVAERRLVTVLFADLVGFTPFAADRDAEEVREALSLYFDTAREVIERYGGTVEKFIGDAVMAVWGAPIAREDDAERAVRAALDLVEGVVAIGPTIQARAGVLTGEAAVTLGATNQGMVAGDLVNTAARLQSVAAPGTVLVGDATQRAASDAIAFEPAGEQVLKGKSSPVLAWRALRVTAQPSGHVASGLPEPPFVGRTGELRLLKDAVLAATRDRRARHVSIIGPAGIGKSRLAFEFEKHLKAFEEPTIFHHGRSPAYGDGIAFWALGEMVRRRAGLAEGDDDATTRAAIARTVAEFVPEPADRSWVEPALLTLLGLGPPPPGGREKLFAAWRILFERIALRGTPVLLFEDLHWADAGLLDFIDHLVEWSHGVPLLVVTLARPELFERRPDWGAGRRGFTAVALDPLSGDEMRELLAGLAPGLPEAAVEAILSRADGIPLYAVEMIRALLADGRLELVDGGYRPVGDLAELAIPETLRSLIASRLDGLDPADRALIQDAGVLGQSFSIPALEAVSGRSEADLEVALRRLVRRQLLEIEADPRSPERGQYRFVQSLIREVAYATLARRDRRRRHLAVARYFETIGDEELAGALAAHFVAAFQASSEGPEADAVATQARLALRAAADRAVALGAHEQAVTHLLQALVVTTDPGDAADTRLAAAISASRAGHQVQAEDLVKDAIDGFRAAGDAEGATLATAELAMIHLEKEEPVEALGLLEGAAAALSADTPEPIRARLLVNLSRVLFRSLFPARAVEIADEALPIAERLGLLDVIADGFNNKAAALSQLGRPREGLALHAAAADVARAGGFVAAELRASANLAGATADHDPVGSFALLRNSLALAERVGDRQTFDWVVWQLMGLAQNIGADWDEAIRWGVDVLAERSGDAPISVVGSLAILRVARGEPADDLLALIDAAGVAAGPDSSSSDWAAAWAQYIRADVALVSGALEAAYRGYVAAGDLAPRANLTALQAAARAALWAGDVNGARQASDRAAQQPDSGSPYESARLDGTRAGIAALEGSPAVALEGYRSVFGRLRDLGFEYVLALVELDLVTVARVDGDLVRAAAMEARATFERVGARPYLELLDVALTRLATAAPTPGAGVTADRSVPAS